MSCAVGVGVGVGVVVVDVVVDGCEVVVVVMMSSPVVEAVDGELVVTVVVDEVVGGKPVNVILLRTGIANNNTRVLNKYFITEEPTVSGGITIFI